MQAPPAFVHVGLATRRISSPRPNFFRRGLSEGQVLRRGAGTGDQVWCFPTTWCLCASVLSRRQLLSRLCWRARSASPAAFLGPARHIDHRLVLRRQAGFGSGAVVTNLYVDVRCCLSQRGRQRMALVELGRVAALVRTCFFFSVIAVFSPPPKSLSCSAPQRPASKITTDPEKNRSILSSW